MAAPADRFETWCDELHERALQELTFSELRKSVQAVSKVYVQGRHRLESGAALDSKGKRAAFASFYAPLHWLTLEQLWEALGVPEVGHVVDLGCGTGIGGASWAVACEGSPKLTGVDVSGWALGEAQRTWKSWGVTGRTVKRDVTKFTLPKEDNLGIVLAYTVNELDERGRKRLVRSLHSALAHGAKLLVIEPIAKSPVPWWEEWVAEFSGIAEAQANTWRFNVSLPAPLAKLDKAAGLHHHQLSCRTLSVFAGQSS